MTAAMNTSRVTRPQRGYLLRLSGVISALALIAMVWAGMTTVVAAPKGARWGAKYFPNHVVQTQDGTSFRFYDDLIKDKIVVVNFMYTSCVDICGLQTARLALVQDRIAARLGKDVFIYSISLDPERDTPTALKQYAEAFGTRPGWLFLTGKPDEVHQIRYKLGERSRSLSEHRNDVVLGNDRTGQWGRSSLMASIDLLVQQIEDMDPEVRRTRRPVPSGSSSGYKLANQPGQALFLKACAACHTVGMGRHIGPDLEGITSRRTQDWIVRYMVAPDKMRHQNDPIAASLRRQFPGVLMPNLGLGETDARDVIAYLKAQTKRLSAGDQTARPGKPGAHAHHARQQH